MKVAIRRILLTIGFETPSKARPRAPPEVPPGTPPEVPPGAPPEVPPGTPPKGLPGRLVVAPSGDSVGALGEALLQ